MSTASPAIPQFSISGTDGFVVALDYLARSADGRGLDALSEIQVSGQPDETRLRWLAAELPKRMPLLHATLCKNGWFGVPYWECSGDAVAVPIEFHRVSGVAGQETSVIESISTLRRLRMQGRERSSLGPPHIRFDVVRTSDQTWSTLHELVAPAARWHGRGTAVQAHERALARSTGRFTTAADGEE